MNAFFADSLRTNRPFLSRGGSVVAALGRLGVEVFGFATAVLLGAGMVVARDRGVMVRGVDGFGMGLVADRPLDGALRV